MLTETGVAARSQEVHVALESSGIKGLTNAQALNALAKILADQPVQIGIFDTDWNQLIRAFPEMAGSSRIQTLISHAAASPEIPDALKTLKDQMASMTDLEKREFFQTLVQREIASMLKMPVEKLHLTKPLMEQGVDSLMASELRNTIYQRFGVSVSVAFLFNYPTVEKVTAQLFSEVCPTEDDDPDSTQDLLGSIEALLAEEEGIGPRPAASS